MLLAVWAMIGYAHNVSPANAMAASVRGSRKIFGQLSQAPAHRSRLSAAITSSCELPYSRIQLHAIVTRPSSLRNRGYRKGRACNRRSRVVVAERVSAPTLPTPLESTHTDYRGGSDALDAPRYTARGRTSDAAVGSASFPEQARCPPVPAHASPVFAAAGSS